MFGRVPSGWQERFEALREHVRETTPAVAVPFGRQYAIDLLRTKYRIRPEKISAVYDALLELAPPVSRPTINIKFDNLKRFIRENEYRTAWDRPEPGEAGGWGWMFHHTYQMARQQAERALGTFGLNPIYGAMSSAKHAARDYGDAFIELKPEVIQERVLLLAGDSWRLVNQKNPVYVGVEKASAIQYHPDWLPDARAAAALLWPPTGCLRQADPYAIAACILEGVGQYGRSGKGERSYTEFHLIGGLTLADVRAFHVTTGRKAEELVRLLAQLGIDLPVFVVGARGAYSPVIEGYPFKIGDRIVLVTGAVARVTGLRQLNPEQAAAQGHNAWLELREMKGPSPSIYGWTLHENIANVPDIYVARVLRPREVYKMPHVTLLMERNRKLMRERGQQRSKEFRERYLRGLPPFNDPSVFRGWFAELLDTVPDTLGKGALQRIADREFVVFDPKLMRRGTGWYYGPGQEMDKWMHDVEGLGVIFGWYEMAHELGVETEPPMAGAPIGGQRDS